MSAAKSQSGDDDQRESALRAAAGKSRIVTFRVSNEEFGSLVRASRAAGSRSLSGFARGATLDAISAMQAPRATLSGDLTSLTKGLAQLDAVLQETSKKIRRVLGPTSFDRDDGECETG